MMSKRGTVALFVICFLFLIGRPLMAVKLDSQLQREEAQIERQEEEVTLEKKAIGPLKVEEAGKNRFRIAYDMPTVTDEPLADIIWMKKAAEVAVKNENPYFNVTEQTYREEEVEGVIELMEDPMKAEYDANEILSLVVPELTE